MDKVVIKKERKDLSTIVNIGLSLLMFSALFLFIAAPEMVDPLQYKTTIDAPVIKVIVNSDERFAMYRVKPGKIFMVHEPYKESGDTIKVHEYRRLLTGRFEYLLAR